MRFVGIVLLVKAAFVVGSKIWAAMQGCARKITAALGQSGHGSELVKRVVAHIAGVIQEIKSPVATLIDFGNVQRPAEAGSEAILKIIWFGAWLSAERIGSGIEDRIADAVIQRAMGPVDVESSPAATKSAAAEPTTAETAASTT